MPWIKVNAEVKKLLAQKSKKTGLSEYDLANNFLSDALKENEGKQYIGITHEEIEEKLGSYCDDLENEQNNKRRLTPEEIDALLDHDWPEGDWVSKKLIDLAEFDYVTDAVELKKNSYKRGKLP